MKGKIAKDSVAGKMKAANIPDECRVFYILHGHFDARDFAGKSIKPKATVAWAVNHKLKRGQVEDIVYDKDLDRCMLVLQDCGESKKVDPKRCMVLRG